MVFFLLTVTVFLQLIKLTKNGNRDSREIISIIWGGVVLLLFYIHPYGIVDFERFEPPTVLVASRRGGGNCNQHIKLYTDNTFVERERCFSASSKRGNWRMINDTIYFLDVKIGTGKDSYYSKAVIKDNQEKEFPDTLLRFKNDVDAKGHELWIVKNEFIND